MKKYSTYIILGALIFFGAYHCPIFSIIGIPCPGCGMTRAYKFLLTGSFSEAFSMHPLFWLPPFLFIKPLRKERFFVLSAIIMIVVYIIRMVILFPNTEPMIYNYNSILGEILK